MARRPRIELNPAAAVQDPGVRRALEELATDIVVDANRATDAPVGITWNWMGDVIRVGPRGAAAYPVEFGTSRIPARRMVKAALDRRRIR